MSLVVYILREDKGFTLFDGESRRLEVPGNMLSEKRALDIFSSSGGTCDLVPIMDAPYDALFEGIEVAVLKHGVELTEFRLEEIFHNAIELMINEADEQQMVYGFFSVKSLSGSFTRKDFEKFFLNQLKEVKKGHTPVCFHFPEFSIPNPYLTDAACIGTKNERRSGKIIDKIQAIEECIVSSLSRFGDLPVARFADNYYLTR